MNQRSIASMPCHECQTRVDVVPCNSCGKAVCPRHRWGLGSLSDGYTCTMNCGMKGFGYSDQLENVKPKPFAWVHKSLSRLPVTKDEAAMIAFWSIAIVAFLLS